MAGVVVDGVMVDGVMLRVVSGGAVDVTLVLSEESASERVVLDDFLGLIRGLMLLSRAFLHVLLIFMLSDVSICM